MLWLTTFFLSAWLVTSCCAWVLRTNVNDTIVPGTTTNVRLMCEMEHINDTTSIKVKDITRIRIVKEPCCLKTVFADRRVRRNETLFPRASVTGSNETTTDSATVMTGMNLPVLEVTWSLAGEDTSGFYGCEVTGYDENNELISEIVASMTIKEKSAALKDLEDLVHAVTRKFDEKLRELEASKKVLEKENMDLRKLIEHKFQNLTQEIERRDIKYQSELAVHERDMKANFVTNQALAGNVSMLKNFTLKEIINDNQRDDKMNEYLLQQIQGSEERFSKNYTKLKSTNDNLKSLINSKFYLLDQDYQTTTERMTSIFNSVTNRFATLNSQLNNATHELQNEIMTRLKTCNCFPRTQPPSSYTTLPTTTTATTITTTLTPEVIEWPGGKYALPIYGIYCPNTKNSTDQGKPLFSIIDFNDYAQISSFPDKQTQQGVFTVKVPRGRRTVNLCGRSDSSSRRADNTAPWPRGLYCINKIGELCPKKFHSGYLKYTVMSSSRSRLMEYTENFCCRADGRVTDPIRLPAEKPFMLFRYGGTCQEVENMRVIPLKRTLDGIPSTSWTYTVETLGDSGDNNFADKDSTGTVIDVCQYLPHNWNDW